MRTLGHGGFARSGSGLSDDMEATEKLTAQVSGHFSPHEGRVLYELARRCAGRGIILEIGSWQGKSTIWLARGSRQGRGGKVFAVDPHTGSVKHKQLYGEVWTLDVFRENIKRAEVDDLVVPLVMTSVEAEAKLPEPVELIFIDGDHLYDFVKTDFETWFPRILDGGIMAFHDTYTEGPRRVVEDGVYRSRRFRNIGIVGSVTFAEKVAENTVLDRLRNRWVLAVKRGSGLFYWRALPRPVRRAGKALVRVLQGRGLRGLG
jgi:predicted O-methyltransferase YrrM